MLQGSGVAGEVIWCLGIILGPLTLWGAILASSQLVAAIRLTTSSVAYGISCFVFCAFLLGCATACCCAIAFSWQNLIIPSSTWVVTAYLDDWNKQFLGGLMFCT